MYTYNVYIYIHTCIICIYWHQHSHPFPGDRSYRPGGVPLGGSGGAWGVSRLARDEEDEIDVVSTASAQTRFHFGAPGRTGRPFWTRISTWFQDDSKMIPIGRWFQDDFKMIHVELKSGKVYLKLELEDLIHPEDAERPSKALWTITRSGKADDLLLLDSDLRKISQAALLFIFQATHVSTWCLRFQYSLTMFDSHPMISWDMDSICQSTAGKFGAGCGCCVALTLLVMHLVCESLGTPCTWHKPTNPMFSTDRRQVKSFLCPEEFRQMLSVWAVDNSGMYSACTAWWIAWWIAWWSMFPFKALDLLQRH